MDGRHYGNRGAGVAGRKINDLRGTSYVRL